MSQVKLTHHQQNTLKTAIRSLEYLVVGASPLFEGGIVELTEIYQLVKEFAEANLPQNNLEGEAGKQW